MSMKTDELYDERASRRFYDERYAEGYMEEWPPEKRRRVRELIRGLGLPAAGDALDFGCGNGVFTEVLREALPGWRVYGTDISAVAVEQARERVRGCAFFEQSDEALAGRKFDFLFTHHVLEHVYDLAEVWRRVIGFMKPASAMLHILPCGNEGSFERELSLLMKGGIEPRRGNRYFFEDTGHVRRLNTDEMRALAAEAGFALAAEYYANQYEGALDWITRNPPEFVRMMTEPARARDEGARRRLARLRRRLLAITLMRTLLDRARGLRGGGLSPKGYVAALAGLALYPAAALLDRRMKRKAEAEWESRRTDPGGSEMYLYFVRRAG